VPRAGPPWLPCRLQICCNGHHWLAGQLRSRGIHYQMADNACTHIADWPRAQGIADGWEAQRIHVRLDELARRGCRSIEIRDSVAEALG